MNSDANRHPPTDGSYLLFIGFINSYIILGVLWGDRLEEGVGDLTEEGKFPDLALVPLRIIKSINKYQFEREAENEILHLQDQSFC